MVTKMILEVGELQIFFCWMSPAWLWGWCWQPWWLSQPAHSYDSQLASAGEFSQCFKVSNVKGLHGPCLAFVSWRSKPCERACWSLWACSLCCYRPGKHRGSSIQDISSPVLLCRTGSTAVISQANCLFGPERRRKRWSSRKRKMSKLSQEEETWGW